MDEITGGVARSDVEVADWTGLPGAGAADAVRCLGLRPGMELVGSSRPRGSVVGQEPSPGVRASRNSVVRLLIADGVGAAEEEGASDATDDVGYGELDEVVSEEVDDGEADQYWERLEAPSEADDSAGWQKRLADGAAEWPSKPVGREAPALSPEPRPAGTRTVRLGSQVGWLLVLGGYAVSLPQTLVALLVAGVSVYAACGRVGVAALIVAGCVLAVGTALAGVAGERRSTGQRLIYVDQRERSRR